MGGEGKGCGEKCVFAWFCGFLPRGLYTYGSNKSSQLGRDDEAAKPNVVEGLEDVRQVGEVFFFGGVGAGKKCRESNFSWC